MSTDHNLSRAESICERILYSPSPPANAGWLITRCNAQIAKNGLTTQVSDISAFLLSHSSLTHIGAKLTSISCLCKST